MPGHSLRLFLLRIFAFILILLTRKLVFAQAAGPQGVPIPPPVAKSKPKADRSALPPIPVFKDVAKEMGITTFHIAAPEARYVIDSISGGAGFSIAMTMAGSTSSW